MTTFVPSCSSCMATLPIVVVLPTPFTPTNSHTVVLPSSAKSELAFPLQPVRPAPPAVPPTSWSEVARLSRRATSFRSFRQDLGRADADVGQDERLFQLVPRLLVELPRRRSPASWSASSDLARPRRSRNLGRLQDFGPRLQPGHRAGPQTSGGASTAGGASVSAEASLDLWRGLGLWRGPRSLAELRLQLVPLLRGRLGFGRTPFTGGRLGGRAGGRVTGAGGAGRSTWRSLSAPPASSSPPRPVSRLRLRPSPSTAP